MKLTVNGNETELTEAVNIAGLLNKFSVEAARAVVEVNGAIIDRSSFDTHRLNDGDSVEIVRFVGGG